MRGLLGSLCILGGGALGILLQSRERRRRRKTLRDLTAALERMGEEIRLTRLPLPRLMVTLAMGLGEETGDFFLRAAEAIGRGETPDTVWRREAQTLSLSERERGILTEVCFQGDEAALCGSIALAVGRLQRCREERAREEAQEIRRSAALWASGAALLVILLI